MWHCAEYLGEFIEGFWDKIRNEVWRKEFKENLKEEEMKPQERESDGREGNSQLTK